MTFESRIGSVVEFLVAVFNIWVRISAVLRYFILLVELETVSSSAELILNVQWRKITQMYREGVWWRRGKMTGSHSGGLEFEPRLVVW